MQGNDSHSQSQMCSMPEDARMVDVQDETSSAHREGDGPQTQRGSGDEHAAGNVGASEKKKRLRVRLPGIMVRLSQWCRVATSKEFSTHLCALAYDNINLMRRIAEQLVGRTRTPSIIVFENAYVF